MPYSRFHSHVRRQLRFCRYPRFMLIVNGNESFIYHSFNGVLQLVAHLHTHVQSHIYTLQVVPALKGNSQLFGGQDSGDQGHLDTYLGGAGY